MPWKRRHAKTMTELLEKEKEASIEQARVEILEAQARAAKDRAEQEGLMAEAEKLYAEAEKLRAENERSRLELQRAKLQLAVEFVSSLNPNLSEAEKLDYVLRLLPALETVISAPLSITAREAVEVPDEIPEKSEQEWDHQ